MALLFSKIWRTGIVTEDLPPPLRGLAAARHADMLLVTGPVTRNMELPLRRTWEATPDPKLVVAVGDWARTCGLFAGSHAVVGGVDRVVPVDRFVPG